MVSSVILITIVRRAWPAGPGSQGHYQIDADTYAHDWQVDYLKVDFCGPTYGPTGGGKVSIQPGAQYAAFKALGDALN